MTLDRYHGRKQGRWIIMILTVSAMATLSGVGAVVPALWNTIASNQRVVTALPMLPNELDNARHLDDIRVEVIALKTKLTQDEEKLGQAQIKATTSCQVSAATSNYGKRFTNRRKSPVHNSRMQPEKLGPSMKEMKELSEYARDVATTVGALDKMLGDPQLLEKRAADLKNGLAHH